jgi:hypothetical protein
MAALAIGKVKPFVFNGDVRDLPQVPQRELEERELEPPFDYKQFLPEAVTGQRAEPNIPLAQIFYPIRNS